MRGTSNTLVPKITELQDNDISTPPQRASPSRLRALSVAQKSTLRIIHIGKIEIA